MTLTPLSNTIFRLFPLPQIITESLPFDPRGAHRGLLGKWRLVQRLREYAFDLIINPGRGEGMLENTILAFSIGGRCRVGLEKNGAGFLNTIKIPLHDDRPIVQQNLDLLRALGITPKFQTVSVRIPEEDLAFADSFHKAHLSSKEGFLAIHPGSHWRVELRWPLQRYVDLAKALLHEYPFRIVLLGTKEEIDFTHKIMTQVGNPRLIDMTGKTTLTQAAAILNCSNLFIGNDSGLLHMALALKVRSVGIFGYTLPQQVISPEGPFIALQKRTGERLYLHQPFFEFRSKGINPIELIEVPDVLQAVKTLLATSLSCPSSHSDG